MNWLWLHVRVQQGNAHPNKPEMFVGQSVEDRVERRVGVGDENGEDVKLLWVRVVSIQNHDECVGSPAVGFRHRRVKLTTHKRSGQFSSQDSLPKTLHFCF